MGAVADEWQWLEYVGPAALWAAISLGFYIVVIKPFMDGHRKVMVEPTPEGRDHRQERPEPLAITAWDEWLSDEQMEMDRHARERSLVSDPSTRRFRVPPYVPQPEPEDPMEETSPLYISKYASSGDKHTPPRKVW